MNKQLNLSLVSAAVAGAFMLAPLASQGADNAKAKARQRQTGTRRHQLA